MEGVELTFKIKKNTETTTLKNTPNCSESLGELAETSALNKQTPNNTQLNEETEINGDTEDQDNRQLSDNKTAILKIRE